MTHLPNIFPNPLKRWLNDQWQKAGLADLSNFLFVGHAQARDMDFGVVLI